MKVLRFQEGYEHEIRDGAPARIHSGALRLEFGPILGKAAKPYPYA